jgi:hypothetical protein
LTDARTFMSDASFPEPAELPARFLAAESFPRVASLPTTLALRFPVRGEPDDHPVRPVASGLQRRKTPPRPPAGWRRDRLLPIQSQPPEFPGLSRTAAPHRAAFAKRAL